MYNNMFSSARLELFAEVKWAALPVNSFKPAAGEQTRFLFKADYDFFSEDTVRRLASADDHQVVSAILEEEYGRWKKVLR